MIGYIKYKLFKWLWDDICAKIDCEKCTMSCEEGFGQCEKCKGWGIDCYDVQDLMYKTARRAWRIE